MKTLAKGKFIGFIVPAICALAFKQPQAILDGNVKRVLTRFFAIEGWPGHAKVTEQLNFVVTEGGKSRVATEESD